MADDDDQKQLLEKLNVGLGKLKSVLALYDPDKYPAQILLRNEDKWIKTVENALSEFMIASNLIEEKLPHSGNDGENAEEWKKQTKLVENMASAFLLKYQTKLLTLTEAAAVPSIGVSPLGASGGQTQAVHAQIQSAAARSAAVNADIDYEKISEEMKVLSIEIHKIDDWSSAESHEIEVAMSKIESWKKQMKSIQNILYSLKKNVRCNNLDENRLRESIGAVVNLKSEFQLIIENIEFEDESRCLFSLNESKTANIAFPTFSGSSDEDYLKFEREMRDCFNRNRIRREDQSRKLREMLKGSIQKIIPENLEDIEQAFQLLKAIYGDPSRVMKAKKAKLMSLGNFPKPGSKQPSHLKMQLEWLMSLELLLKEVFQLTTLSKDMYCEIFSPSTLRSIKSFFPYYLLEEMCLLPHDTTKNTMEGLYNFIIDLREKIQLIIRDTGGDGVLDFCHNLVRTRSDATGGCAEDDNANGDDRDYNLNHVPGAKGSQVFQLDVLMAGGEVSDVDVDHEPEDVDDASSPYDEDDLYAMLTSVDAMPDLNLSH